MADVKYTLLDQELNSIPENELISATDLNLIDSFEISKRFNPKLNYIEGHIYSLSNSLLLSDYEVQLNLNLDGKVDDDGLDSLNIDPVQFAGDNGFGFSDSKVVFHFLNDLYSYNNSKISLYIDSISKDRKEILLYTDSITENTLITKTEDISDMISSGSYFEEIYLNLGDNDLLIVTNIDVFEKTDKFTIAVKLYEPLPSKYKTKAVGQLVEKVSDSIGVKVGVTITEDQEPTPKLRSANFDIETSDSNPIPTEYFNYDDLFSYDISNSNKEIYSYLNEKSVAINVDYSDYKNFVHFSSAEERLKNFRYKVRLIENYQSNLDSLTLASNGLSNTLESQTKFKNLIKGVVSNFDSYENHLYFESGSTSWPKSTTTKPHINLHSNSSEVSNWYSGQLSSASSYDSTNYDLLSATLPSYIAEDTNNSKAILFIHMLGQHYDNLWVYTKAVTDKYDNDNRLDVGISKDLVRETLISFGVKLYNSKEGQSDLFKYLIADSYDSGSNEEVINTFTSVPNLPADAQPLSRKNYEGELYKRIYHNLPFLLKTKGTERGLRALINCFGIPSNFLSIKQYGGSEISSDRFIGYENEVTSSEGKIRYETRASGSVGSVLTKDRSIQKSEVIRNQDIHRLEVGFSPADSINDYILSQLPATFNIDNYIGDPRDLNKGQYLDLMKEAHRVLHNSVERAQLNDFVRILKFYDNVLFKMIKDFVPAKATLDTGIIVKPHILNRSKIKSPDLSGTRPEYSGSIDTAFTEGTHGGSYEVGVLNLTKELDLASQWTGSFGGISDFSFLPDHRSPISPDPGEISIHGTTFYHPDSTVKTFDDRVMTVYTPFEGTYSERKDFYLMYTSESVTDRFSINTGFDRQHQNVVAISFKESDGRWYAADNSDQYYDAIDPLPSDVIIAAASLTDTNTIGYFVNYTKPLTNILPGKKSTLHKLDINTKSGSVIRWVEDEAPKFNGELSGSQIEVTDGELNKPNVFKQVNVPVVNYNIETVDAGTALTYTGFTLAHASYSTSGSSCTTAAQSMGTYYHNGANALPEVGDYVFDGINDADGKDGGGNWFKAYDPATGENFTLRISGSSSGNAGYVGNKLSCTLFDEDEPTGYSASWNMLPQNILAANSGSVPFIIYDAEVGATYNVTASLESAPSIKATATGLVTGNGATTDFSSSIDCSTLADGNNVLLDVTLVDGSSNRGVLAPVGPNFGNTLTASIKDTSVPTVSAIAFKNSNYTMDVTTNDNGNFYMLVTGLPNAEQGTIAFTLTSTGGGTFSNTVGWNTNYGNVTQSGFAVGNYFHSLNAGTVTVSATVSDNAGNTSGTVTDTISYQPSSGTMSVLYGATPNNMGYWQQTFYFSVTMSPSNASWYLSSPSWVTITGYTGNGSDSSVTCTVSQNQGSSARIGTIYLKSQGSGTTLDLLALQQQALCVAPNTLILMADGTQKRAGDIQVGDVVKTKHETTLEDMNANVYQKQVYTNKRIKVYIGDKEIICSPGHRFYVDNKEDFIAADQLVEGDILSGKDYIRREEYEDGDVVKISVEHAQTYISEGILSHNIK